MEQLQRERVGRREPEERTARTGTLIGAFDPKTVKEMKARINERNRVWIAQPLALGTSISSQVLDADIAIDRQSLYRSTRC